MIATLCTATRNCKCGATGCPEVCASYANFCVVSKPPEKVAVPKKKSYEKFISSRINTKGKKTLS